MGFNGFFTGFRDALNLEMRLFRSLGHVVPTELSTDHNYYLYQSVSFAN